VNALLLIMALLVLSYIGSFLVSGRTIRGVGLPSGIEWVVLGVLFGPGLLGIVGESAFGAVEPVVVSALGWLALLVGLDYGRVGGRSVAAGRFVLGIAWALFTGGAAFAAAYIALPYVIPQLAPFDGLFVSGAIGVASCETTRHVVRWAAERHRAAGPLTDLLADISDTQDVVPLVGVAILFATRPSTASYVRIPALGWLGMTLALGAVMGLATTVLLGREFRLRESWGVLLGTSLLAIGVAARLELPILSVLFTMGVVVAATSRHRDEVHAMGKPTERAVLLPVLLLVGVRINPNLGARFGALVATVIVARVAAKYAAGRLLGSVLADARSAGPRLGFAMLSSGALSMSIGLTFALRFPGLVGDSVLATTATLALFGELVGPASLTAALRHAGEIVEMPASNAPAPRVSSSRTSRPSWSDTSDDVARQGQNGHDSPYEDTL
jgi:hypothetical protein